MTVVPLHADRRRRLDEVVAELEDTRWAFEVVDSSWRLYHVSAELRELLLDYKEPGEEGPIGEHFVTSRYAAAHRHPMLGETDRTFDHAIDKQRLVPANFSLNGD